MNDETNDATTDAPDSDNTRWLDGATEPAKRALRQALDEAPRFASSDVRQRRVWARVADPRRAGRVVRRAFVMGALVAAGLGGLTLVSLNLLGSRLGAFLERPQRPAAVDTIAAAPGHTASPAPSPPPTILPLPPRTPEVVRTTAGQRVTHLFRQGVQADVQPNSIMSVDDDGTPDVRAGQVAFKVAHQPSGQRFQVRARTFKVVVVGTRFVVKVNELESQGRNNVKVTVDEGVVEIWRQVGDQDRIARLHPGQSWAGSDLEVRPVRAATRASLPSASGRRDGKLVPALAPPPPPVASDQGSDLAAARAARTAADPKRALAIYQRLAEGGGPLAENALYEIGGIYRDQLHQPRLALSTWERYRSRYPGGLLRAEADLSIVDTLSGLGDSARALKEALAFLERYPRSERRGEMARVAGDLFRARGNCGAAADMYRRVDATNASATDADDAAFGRAACLGALGDPGAAAAVRSYLHDRPAGRHRGEAARLLGGASPTDQP